MKYIYQANGNLIKKNIFEHFTYPEKISLRKHLMDMSSDSDRINELERKLNNLEISLTKKISDMKEYFPFLQSDSKLLSIKSNEWKKEETGNGNFYVDVAYDVSNDPQIFTQINQLKNKQLNYVYSIKDITKKGFRLNIKFTNYKYDDFRQDYIQEESVIKDSFMLNSLIVG